MICTSICFRAALIGETPNRPLHWTNSTRPPTSVFKMPANRQTWIAQFKTLRRQFETLAKRTPRLCHVLVEWPEGPTLPPRLENVGGVLPVAIHCDRKLCNEPGWRLQSTVRARDDDERAAIRGATIKGINRWTTSCVAAWKRVAPLAHEAGKLLAVHGPKGCKRIIAPQPEAKWLLALHVLRGPKKFTWLNILLPNGERRRAGPPPAPLTDRIQIRIDLSSGWPTAADLRHIAADLLSNAFMKSPAAVTDEDLRRVDGLPNGFFALKPNQRVTMHRASIIEDICLDSALAISGLNSRSARKETAPPLDEGRPTRKSSARQPRGKQVLRTKWDKEMKDRNKFAYDECVKDTPYKHIVAAVKAKRQWKPLRTINGVKRAARAYAKWAELPVPHARQRGRPTKV